MDVHGRVIIAMIPSDIETLEVFYAHTILPIYIAVIVPTSVFLFVGVVSSWYLACIALLGYITIGVVALFGSFGSVIALSALPGNLTQTFASGDRVLNLRAAFSAAYFIFGVKKYVPADENEIPEVR